MEARRRGRSRATVNHGSASKLNNCALLAIVALILGVSFAVTPASAADPRFNGGGVFLSDGAAVQRVVVTLNKSRTFNVQPFTRALVAAVDIADVLPLSDRSIYVQGKKVGTTNISLIDANARLIGVLDLEVVPDTGNLQQKINAGSGSRRIRVSSSGGQIILSGEAVDAVAAERAMRIAQSFAGEGGAVVNAITVAPSQQVMLEVRFLEVSRDAGRQLGISLFGANRSGTRGIRTGFGQVGVDPVTPKHSIRSSNLRDRWFTRRRGRRHPLWDRHCASPHHERCPG